jgi:hypothetical protein
MNGEWEAGTTPWIRQRQPERSWNHVKDNTVQCYFCGQMTAKRSTTDHDQDTGRVELYCQSDLCDAREMVVLVRRDGAGATWRADSRALAALDEGRLDIDEVLRQTSSEDMFLTFSEVARDRSEETVQRRTAHPQG